MHAHRDKDALRPLIAELAAKFLQLPSNPAKTFLKSHRYGCSPHHASSAGGLCRRDAVQAAVRADCGQTFTKRSVSQ
jgi:hypothetical protein